MHGFVINNNNNINSLRQNNNSVYALHITSTNFMEFVESEGKDTFEMKYFPTSTKWRTFCDACHRFAPSKKTWSKGKDMTAEEASSRRYLFLFVLFCFDLFLSRMYIRFCTRE